MMFAQNLAIACESPLFTILAIRAFRVPDPTSIGAEIIASHSPSRSGLHVSQRAQPNQAATAANSSFAKDTTLDDSHMLPGKRTHMLTVIVAS
jgi:hypothetical protein